jgi:hypothetical protein
VVLDRTTWAPQLRVLLARVVALDAGIVVERILEASAEEEEEEEEVERVTLRPLEREYRLVRKA